ncbi:MAG TPA: alpha-L-arabinofuranosidase C-terminal domain-containing protein [Tepidisphaeraceae bacterium]|nr:alpha-L-arabinofuranosidase C-terminal domain-containing protein [Tepidisphaeraceae bacterium]
MSDPFSAQITIDTNRTIGEVSPLLFGGFAEHMGRCVYEGIYDPTSPHADERGYRKDVLAALKSLNLTVLRYPGGNFVSNYDWRDGVGPRERRPRRRELAWQQIETNQFGTDEFLDYCKRLSCQPMIGLNFGTGNIKDHAADLVEYCNAPAETALADLRAANGHREPYGVKYWCLGNEMDGPWQMGALSAEQYGLKAREAAKLMRWQDPSIKTILCGSSGPGLKTYPEWDRVALEIAWEQSDFLAMHNYATNYENDTTAYLGYAIELEDQVDTLAATLRYVKAKLRSTRDVYLSWDEWNVWYKDRSGQGGWTEAPHLSEELYNLEDALVVAQWLSVFLRKCDVVKIACLAQIVNTISPILTAGHGLLKQSTYYPFELFSRHAKGISLDALVKCPCYETKRFGDVPVLDVSATFDPATGKGALFVVNRSLAKALPTTIHWQGHLPERITMVRQLSGIDPKAANSFAHPDVVVPEELTPPLVNGGGSSVILPPLSFTAFLTSDA